MVKSQLRMRFQMNSVPLPEWIKVKSAQQSSALEVLNQFLDKGEASAISLVLENTDSLIILDDLKARKVANSLRINITGTLGVIVKAHKRNLISDLNNIIDRLKATDFRISETIINDF